jgi:hypothetical protein
MSDSVEHDGSQNAPLVFGFPSTDGTSPLVQQHYDDTCAIRSQELILRDFGVHVSEDSLRNEAMIHGWYSPGKGTPAGYIGGLLEDHGVSVHKYENANIFTLSNELAQGHKVIIGVDSGELWNKGALEGIEDFLGVHSADHALIVSGIDTSDPDNVKVVITDPGSGDIAKAYPMDQFLDAWKDSNCFMVATNNPPPVLSSPGMINFNYDTGHLASIGDLSYEDFLDRYSTYATLPFTDGSGIPDNAVDHFLHDIAHESTWPRITDTADIFPHYPLVTQEPTIADLIEHHDAQHDQAIDDPSHHFREGYAPLTSNGIDPALYGDGLEGFMDDMLNHDDGMA